MIGKIVKWWKRRKFNLRQACIDKYSNEFGDEFGKEFRKMYDDVTRGIPIGGFAETTTFLQMIETVKKESGLY